uniref:Uncharacterized protein n=1 Tax=Arundo donax TaxID=35708 RepID=A0A0A9HTW5_ARUDO
MKFIPFHMKHITLKLLYIKHYLALHSKNKRVASSSRRLQRVVVWKIPSCLSPYRKHHPIHWHVSQARAKPSIQVAQNRGKKRWKQKGKTR